VDCSKDKLESATNIENKVVRELQVSIMNELTNMFFSAPLDNPPKI
jgi:hypothetical protein